VRDQGLEDGGGNGGDGGDFAGAEVTGGVGAAGLTVVTA
jgi:hypothetical protein